LFRIKGYTYTLPALLGQENGDTKFDGGEYMVIYLHPRDYHRVHVPVSAQLTRTIHIPGTRYPVTGWCDDRVEGIFEKNERMVFFLNLPGGGHLAMVMVAAFGVGNIDTTYDPGFGQGYDVRRERQFTPPVDVGKGDDLGAFLLGSTVVMVWSKGAIQLNDTETGPIAMGRKIGNIGIFDMSRP
jgi:phosphatidylserine decarboxylase